MTSQLPLYSRGRPLKNLLSDFTKNNGTHVIVVGDWDYINPLTPIVLEENERDLYKAFVEKWYFANIGFDTDDEFIYRFNAIWNSNISKYVKLYNDIKVNGYSYERKTSNYTTDKSGEDTEQRKGSGSKSISVSGSDVTAKGITTTSTQNTSNVGDKLGRATPTEKLSVSGDSTTTVSDSGQDTSTHNSSSTETDNPNYENKQLYGSHLNNDGMEVHEKLTPAELNAIYRQTSVLNEFALCFEKLFMEVF